jgi:hypothetical protein
MSAHSRTPLSGRLAGFLIVAAAMAGLFVMHGLSPHGTAHPAPAPAGMSADSGIQHSDELPGDEGAADLLMLCLALLVAGLVMFAGGRLAGRWPSDDRVPADHRSAPPASRRDRDPPDLRLLSIQRC